MQALTDIEKMVELLEVPVEVCDQDDAVDLVAAVVGMPRERRDVVFEGVHFGYAGGDAGGTAGGTADGVRGLSLRIACGGSVALVGPSGSGKSTCVRLLCRLFDVHGGAIMVCGHDVRAVSQHSLRTVVACVTQDTVLFNASIRFNVTYGARDATEEQLQRACRLASVEGYVSRLKDGLETPVGERGLRLSGGEKQRLGLARALLREPTVLVLDEATSALDSKTEQEVQTALREAAKGRCTLSVAHRLSTVVECDEIIVLNAGTAVERGSHSALLQMPGSQYATLWAKQSSAGADSAGRQHPLLPTPGPGEHAHNTSGHGSPPG